MHPILLQQIKNHDKKAFEILYDQHANHALRVATVVTGSHVAAKEAVCETFVQVYDAIKAYKPDVAFEHWLYRILIQACKQVSKKESKVAYMRDYIEPNLLHEEHEEHEPLYHGILSLDCKYKIPMVLKYLKRFNDSEIAMILEMDRNTIKSRLDKGKQQLMKTMKISEDRRCTNGTGKL